MARVKENELPPDVPSWLMTFSDVITLLMTFFILLLTFATAEPEQFEQMQAAMFGGGGALGLAGPAQRPTERDTLLIRTRPPASRITAEGSEIPPIDSDPAYESLARGVAGLDDLLERPMASQHAMYLPLSLVFTSDGTISSFGEWPLQMIARKMQTGPMTAAFFVAREQDLERAGQLANRLFEGESIPADRLSVGRDASVPASALKIVLTYQPAGSPDGS
jgi:hypothetical protein